MPGWMVLAASKIEACTSSFPLLSASGGAVGASGAGGGFAVASVSKMLPTSPLT